MTPEIYLSVAQAADLLGVSSVDFYSTILQHFYVLLNMTSITLPPSGSLPGSLSKNLALRCVRGSRKHLAFTILGLTHKTE